MSRLELWRERRGVIDGDCIDESFWSGVVPAYGVYHDVVKLPKRRVAVNSARQEISSLTLALAPVVLATVGGSARETVSASTATVVA